jgi:tetratricopeptide (TPR) repeat protein
MRRSAAVSAAALLFIATPCLGLSEGATRLQQELEGSRTPVTFATGVAPIVFQKCSPCHQPGGSAPFSLLTYPEVKGRARQIVTAVTRRSMPPWKPESGYGEFSGARQLSDNEISTFQQWFDGGGLAGDTSKLPPAPLSADGWRLGTPDAVLSLSEPYRLRPGGPDRLRHFVIPVQLSERRYIKAWEFRTSTPRVVHHAMVNVDPTRASRSRDQLDPEPGFEGVIPLSAKMPDGYFVDWTPGQIPYVAPPQMAWSLEKDSDVVLTLHLRPTSEWETIDARLGLYFSDAPPSRTPTMIRLSYQNIDIPPGERHYTITDSYTLPVDVDAYDIKPHAHNLAEEIRGFADLPDGGRKWLIYIRKWDFHWQDSYRYASPVSLPAGTRVSMEYTYDNSAENPANPNKPARRVTFGQETTDEMGDLWIQVLPRNPADLAILNSSIKDKMLPADISGYEMMLQSDPNNVTLHEDLSGLYLAANDFQNAARQSAQALRLKPDVAAAHYNLGYDLLRLRRWDEAEDHFRKALSLDPNHGPSSYGLGLTLWARGRPGDATRHFRDVVGRLPLRADAHYNLGVVLQWNGKLDDALTSYRKALDIDPTYVDAQFAVGLIRAAHHEPKEAIASFTRALELRPDWPPAQIQMAWLLSTSPDASIRDPHAALSLAERAVALTRGQDANALEALAAALAAAGRFESAVQTVERALAALGPGADRMLVAGARRRLALYREGKPYLESR